MTMAVTKTQPGEHAPTVYVVDDDDGMRRGVAFLLQAANLPVQCFDSATAFLEHYAPDMRGCLLLDVRMPGMSGLELQQQLRARRILIPVIIVTAYADVSMAVRAMHAGAFDFFEKPFESRRLLERIRQAMLRDVEQYQDDQQVRQINERVALLTAREREVMELVVSGILNKELAAMLKISLKTVENHRASIMKKMQVEYLADLVRMAITVGMV